MKSRIDRLDLTLFEPGKVYDVSAALATYLLDDLEAFARHVEQTVATRTSLPRSHLPHLRRPSNRCIVREVGAPVNRGMLR
jgi:hypothetical protein